MESVCEYDPKFTIGKSRRSEYTNVHVIVLFSPLFHSLNFFRHKFVKKKKKMQGGQNVSENKSKKEIRF